MASREESAKSKFYKGLFRFLWAELKTMNMEKIRSLTKLTIGYTLVKMAKRRSLHRPRAIESR